jgi:microcystin-dependent protein
MNMADTYVGEIRAFAFDYDIADWLPCDGRLLNINSYQILFSLISNTYGGDGVYNFALPDLRNRTIIGTGQGPNMINRTLAERGGADDVTLSLDQVGGHSHTLKNENFKIFLKCTNEDGSVTTPVNKALANAVGTTPTAAKSIYNTGTPDTAMNAGCIALTGRTDPNTTPMQSHNNMQPYLTIRYCIATSGVYPNIS